MFVRILCKSARMLVSMTDWRRFVAYEDQLTIKTIEFRIGKCYISPDAILNLVVFIFSSSS